MKNDTLALDAMAVTPELVAGLWKLLKKHGIQQVPVEQEGDNYRDQSAVIYGTAEDLLKEVVKVAVPIKQPESSIRVVNTIEEMC